MRTTVTVQERSAPCSGVFWVDPSEPDCAGVFRADVSRCGPAAVLCVGWGWGGYLVGVNVSGSLHCPCTYTEVAQSAILTAAFGSFLV